MKNLLIVIALAAIAFLAYNYFQAGGGQGSGTSSTTDTATTESSAQSALISTAPEDAEVFIMEPGDGSIVTSPVTVKFGLTNMQLAPAGENIEDSGHHHLLIDLAELPDMSVPLPASDQIVHFGKAQTETTIELAPGVHSLQLLLGNYLHIPHDNAVISKKITITVE